MPNPNGADAPLRSDSARLIWHGGRTREDGATRVVFTGDLKAAPVRSHHAILFVAPDRHADNPTQSGAFPDRACFL